MRRTSIGDVALNVEERGVGAPLLLVHGFPLDHTMWRGQIDVLATQCRVIAPDLRGFGQSDVTPGTVTMERFADDLAALLDALRITEPITFCGMSMGGYIGWQFAARHRRRLAKLVLCDTRAVADTADAAAGRLKTADKVLAEGAQVVADGMLPKLFAPSAIERNADYVSVTREVIQRTNPEGIAAALRGMAERPDFSSRLNAIDVPVLVLCGELDAISPPAEMRQIAAAIPGAQYAEIPAAGHMAVLENPAVANAKIADFLAK